MPSASIGVSTGPMSPVARAVVTPVQTASDAGLTSSSAPSDWSAGLTAWSGSSGRTHLYGDPSATWTTYANESATSVIVGKVRTAPNGAELVGRVLSQTQGTAWLRMQKVANVWVYSALENGEPASLAALSTCASCHQQSSADSVYFSPTK